MCQKRFTRERCNEGLLRSLVGVLLLFSSFLNSACSARGATIPSREQSYESYAAWPRRLATAPQAAPATDGVNSTTPAPSEVNSTTPAPSESTRVGNSSRRSDNSTVSAAPPAPSPEGNSTFLPARTVSSPTTEAASHHNHTESTSKTSLSNSSRSSKMPSLMWVLLIGPAAVLVVVALFIAAKVRFMVRKRRREGGSGWKKGLSDSESGQLEKTSFAGVPENTIEELEAACEDFTNVIGASTDCIVFKGTRPDGVQIAVTRIRIPPSNWTPQREIGFRRKVEDLARMNHDNLVNLLAYCTSETPFERMLVFEYASNGTLYEHLHGRQAAADHLDWKTRMRIVMGAAYGLQYMHHELDPPASHFKFDASHVFLTEDYAAKVADFGISAVSIDTKSLGRRKSFKKIVRAIGYSDWDGYRHVPYLESNIRSFGVFLLETITGRTIYTETQGPLIDWAKKYLNNPAKMWKLVDPSLNSYKKKELIDICEVIRLCIQPKANRVPSMSEVTGMLAKALHMSPDVANSKGSPLLWAEMELLASMDSSFEELGSPRHDSGKESSEPPWVTDALSKGPHISRSKTMDIAGTDLEKTSKQGGGSPRSNLSRLSSSTGSRSSNPLWADDASELEFLSPQEDVENSSSSEDTEVPLASTLNTSTTLKMSSSRSSSLLPTFSSRAFQRVRSENSPNESSKLDFLAPRTNSDRLER